MIGLTSDGNWCKALVEHLPEAVADLREKVARIEAERDDALDLIATYESLIAIAKRRSPDVQMALRELERDGDYTRQGRD